MTDPDDDWVPTGKWANPAIYASNWRRIIVVDALLGTVLVAVGVALMAGWNVVGGAFVAALGLTYVLAVGRRYLQWRWLRRRAGLDGGLPPDER